MIQLLASHNKERNSVRVLDVEEISKKYDEFIEKGTAENPEEKIGVYHKDTERALLRRLTKFKENYLMWTVNKMKVSGQFQNIASAENFAKLFTLCKK